MTTGYVEGAAETRPPLRFFRRAGAVLAGMATTAFPSIALDALFHATGIFPPFGKPMSDGLFLLAMSYRVITGVAGGYVTARFAPDRPMTHAMIYGAIGVVLSTAGVLAMWDAGPAWYSLGIIATALPCAWLGGKLAVR